MNKLKDLSIYFLIITFNIAIQSCNTNTNAKTAKDTDPNKNTDTNTNTSTNANPQDRSQTSDLIQRGEYLVTITGCNDCHTPKLMGPHGPMLDTSRLLSGYPQDRPRPEFSQQEIRNGFIQMNEDLTAVAGPWGTTYGSNITSDDTGIGNWTEDQFRIALTHGKYKGLENGRPLMPPMPWQNYVNMKDEDLKAIFSYLKSTRPIKNIAPEFQPPATK